MQKQLIVLSIIFAVVLSQADFRSAAYQQQNRNSKLQQLVQAINQDTTSGSFPSTLGLLGIFTESMKVTEQLDADIMPDGRTKYIHSVGNTASVQFIAESNTPYTGLFQGADSAIIRLSCAKSVDNTKTSASQAYDNFTPGFGLKFLVDGLPSVNLVAMYGVNGVDTWNFFGRDFSNHIPGSQGAVLTALANKFSEATKHVQTVGLRDFSTKDQTGKAVANPKFPWRLIFRAPDALKNQYTDDFQADYKDILSAIPSGTHLYDVYAIDSPTEACEVLIGKLVTTSALTTSKFGDQQLFFRHQSMENDIAIHPENTDYTPTWKGAFANNNATKVEGACPYANN